MKSEKKIGRKLTLNKETIAKLEQDNIRGGRTDWCNSDPCRDNTIFEQTNIKCTYVSGCPCS